MYSALFSYSHLASSLSSALDEWPLRTKLYEAEALSQRVTVEHIESFVKWLLFNVETYEHIEDFIHLYIVDPGTSVFVQIEAAMQEIVNLSEEDVTAVFNQTNDFIRAYEHFLKPLRQSVKEQLDGALGIASRISSAIEFLLDVPLDLQTAHHIDNRLNNTVELTEKALESILMYGQADAGMMSWLLFQGWSRGSKNSFIPSKVLLEEAKRQECSGSFTYAIQTLQCLKLQFASFELQPCSECSKNTTSQCGCKRLHTSNSSLSHFSPKPSDGTKMLEDICWAVFWEPGRSRGEDSHLLSSEDVGLLFNMVANLRAQLKNITLCMNEYETFIRELSGQFNLHDQLPPYEFSKTVDIKDEFDNIVKGRKDLEAQIEEYMVANKSGLETAEELKVLIPEMNRYAHTLKDNLYQRTVLPLQTAIQELQNGLQEYYIRTMLGNAVKLVTYAPKHAEDITQRVKDIRLWRAPMPTLQADHAVDFTLPPSSGASVIQTSLQSFYNSRGKSVIKAYVQQFCGALLDNTTELMAKITDLVETSSKKIVKKMEYHVNNLEAENQIDDVFVK